MTSSIKLKPGQRPIGHEAKWAALARAFAKDKVPQTLLFSGPAHVGKWTFVQRFAQLLLCPQVETDESGLPSPCGHCKICHQVEIETFPDIRVYRPIVSSAKEERDWVTAPEALEGGGIYIDMARKFGDEAMRKPLVGPRKVMIIQGADRMTLDAQNALLKTFEEPVNGLTILLIATNANELLPTVRSRCWHVPLGLAADNAISEWLQGALPGLTGANLQAAVQAAAGCPGAAWREAVRLQENTEGQEARYATVSAIVERIRRCHPVGALGLTEEAIRLSKDWWQEDFGEKELKKGDAKVARSAAARFLDELTKVYRARWQEAVSRGGSQTEGTAWMDGLDQIRKTRHYILSNASTTLALDVLFGRLIALHR